MSRSVRSDIAPNRIREIRMQKQMTMEQLGDAIGVNFSTVAKLERSQRTLSLDMLAAIARVLEVTPAELIGPSTGGKPLRVVPVLGKIAAGNWREAIEHPIGQVSIPEGGANSFGLMPEGDSMNAICAPGAIVVVDPDDRELFDGKVYAFSNADRETTFKRFRTEPARLEPVSTNPDHKAIPYDFQQFSPIGRVIWQVSPL